MTAAEALAQAAAEGLTLQRADSAAGYKHVRLGDNVSKPFQACPWNVGRPKSLGSFATPEEAALAVARYNKLDRPPPPTLPLHQTVDAERARARMALGLAPDGKFAPPARSRGGGGGGGRDRKPAVPRNKSSPLRKRITYDREFKLKGGEGGAPAPSAAASARRARSTRRSSRASCASGSARCSMRRRTATIADRRRSPTLRTPSSPGRATDRARIMGRATLRGFKHCAPHILLEQLVIPTPATTPASTPASTRTAARSSSRAPEGPSTSKASGRASSMGHGTRTVRGYPPRTREASDPRTRRPGRPALWASPAPPRCDFRTALSSSRLFLFTPKTCRATFLPTTTRRIRRGRRERRRGRSGWRRRTRRGGRRTSTTRLRRRASAGSSDRRATPRRRGVSRRPKMRACTTRRRGLRKSQRKGFERPSWAPAPPPSCSSSIRTSIRRPAQKGRGGGGLARWPLVLVRAPPPTTATRSR